MINTKLNQPDKGNEPDFRLIGPWEAIVTDNRDKDKEGKLNVKIPRLFGNKRVKAVRPKYGLNHQDIPKKNQFVWIEFQHLDSDLPMWYGSWYPKENKPSDIDHDPENHIYLITDENKNPLLTIKFKENSELLIKEHTKNNFAKFNLGNGNVEIESPEGDLSLKSTQKKVIINSGSDTEITANQNCKINTSIGTIQLNGGLLDSARKTDETTHICVLSGSPVKGLITGGHSKVKHGF